MDDVVVVPEWVSSANAESYPPLLSTHQVAKRTALTSRQVTHWADRGYIMPLVDAQGSGSARLWNPSVIDQINDLEARIEACPFPHGRVVVDA